MNGKLRHIERRKAAKEKEQEKWGEFDTLMQKAEDAQEIIERLREKNINVLKKLEKMGIDCKNPDNYLTENFFSALKLLEQEHRG
jgi:hypothetical protein